MIAVEDSWKIYIGPEFFGSFMAFSAGKRY
jgi:hypothetical protein